MAEGKEKRDGGKKTPNCGPEESIREKKQRGGGKGRDTGVKRRWLREYGQIRPLGPGNRPHGTGKGSRLPFKRQQAKKNDLGKSSS